MTTPVSEVLRLFLVGKGYLVSTVGSGQEALDAVPMFRPDVIVVDMVMPGSLVTMLSMPCVEAVSPRQ